MRICLIEDEHKIVNAIKKALTQEHYDVEVAYDGDEGYNLALSNTYDLCIIDWTLAGRHDGTAIIKAMRDAKIHTPVILLSDKKTGAERTAGLNSGADEYIAKPFSMHYLLSHIQTLLKKPNENIKTLFKAKDLSLDMTTFEVKRGNDLIHLTGKEFALLEYLMRNMGKPVSKEDITNYVWDYDADVLPNTVEVYIKYLRQKIDDPYDHQLLHTMRGFGYKIQP